MKFCLRTGRMPFPGRIHENGKDKKVLEFSQTNSKRLLEIEKEMVRLEKETLDIFLDYGVEIQESK